MSYESLPIENILKVDKRPAPDKSVLEEKILKNKKNGIDCYSADQFEKYF